MIRASSPQVVITGHAPGADQLAENAATMHGVPLEVYHANWDRDGRSAGYIRNRRMLEEGKPDRVLAFVIGESPGTRNMIAIAEKADIPVTTYELITN